MSWRKNFTLIKKELLRKFDVSGEGNK